ncbi:hypothetical protein Bbelb_004710 [Branchiostoma belcheri]|nr:hypothetical protein Bbelb_004710 [Branchiostoma belcheri]
MPRGAAGTGEPTPACTGRNNVQYDCQKFIAGTNILLFSGSRQHDAHQGPKTANISEVIELSNKRARPVKALRRERRLDETNTIKTRESRAADVWPVAAVMMELRPDLAGAVAPGALVFLPPSECLQ